MLAEELRPEAAVIYRDILTRVDAHTRLRLDEALLATDSPLRAEAVLRLIATLNSEQLSALLHDHALDGPLLVLAGAGSGKTAVLTRRVVYLLLRGADPASLFVVTFTNKAAGEMRERVQRLMLKLQEELPRGGAELLAPLLAAAPGLWLGTFHSACLRLLKDKIPGCGQANIERLSYKPEFRIMEPLQAKALVEQALAEAGPAALALGLDAALDGIEKARNELRDPAVMAADGRTDGERLIGVVLARYQEKKKARRLLDFNDIISFAVELLQNDPEVGAHYGARFRYVLIDEYQDTNFAQYVLARQLARETANLFVVGDDDQSIYGWRGADIRNILQFREDYPQSRVVKLVKNYRSSRTIISAANRVFDQHKPAELRKQLEPAATGAGGKVLEGEKIIEYLADDEKDEAAFVIFAIQKAMAAGARAGDCAIFYRVNDQARPLKDALAAAGLPYLEFGDHRFFALREIDNTIAYLRLAGVIARVRTQGADAMEEAVLDDAGERLAQLLGVPHCGFSEADLLLLTATTGAWRTLTDDEQYGLMMARLSPDGRAALDRFIDIFYRVIALLVADNLDPALDLLWRQLGYLDGGGDEHRAQVLRRHLDAFRHLLAIWRDKAGGAVPALAGLEALAAFLADLDEKKRDPQSLLAAGGDAVLLMTLHSSKGLEFPHVFFTGLEDGLCPFAHFSDRELDRAGRELRFGEELRLFYVGITRARLQLYLTHARVRTRFGRTSPMEPSPFLKLLPAHAVRRGDARGSVAGRLWERVSSLWDQ